MYIYIYSFTENSRVRTVGQCKGHRKLSILRSRSINPIRGPQEVRLIEISRGPLTSNRCQTQPETRRKEREAGGSLAGEYTEFEIYPVELTINLVPRR